MQDCNAKIDDVFYGTWIISQKSHTYAKLNLPRIGLFKIS